MDDLTILVVCGAALITWCGLLFIRYGKRAARTLRSIFCRHVTVSVTTLGAAAFSQNGDVELTTQMTCDACSESWIAPLDATESLRLGMRA